MNFKILTIGALATLASCSNQKPNNEAAAEVKSNGFDLEAIDSSASPCTDFFQYTAGNWIKENPIPETESRWGKFSELAENNKIRVKTILEEYAAKTDLAKGTDGQLIGDFFYSGMDSLAVENAGKTQLTASFEKIDNVENKDDLFTLMAQNSYYGVSAPFGIGVQADLMNSSENALYLDQSGLGLPDRDYYLKTDSVSVDVQNKYKTHLANMFVLSGTDQAIAEANAEKVYSIEYQLAEQQMSRVEMRNIPALYNPKTLAELKTIAPAINFENYFSVFNLTFDQIIVGSPKYVTALNTLFSEVALADWKTYYKWKTLTSTAGYLPYAFAEESFDFYGKTLQGTKKMQPRWKRVQGALGGLGEQLGHLYVDKYFPEESKKHVEQMVEDLRSAYRVRIEGLTWMSDTTKVKALEKLEAFTYKIGYPNTWKDYSDLEISRDNYLQNAMNMRKYKTEENFAKLGKPVDRSEWGMGAHIVNAYYNPLNNEVVFPAGILQPPFYDANADDALNYGAIGGVIGHEFSHGFDDQGSNFDAHGNMTNWWTEGDKARFDALTQALSEQYSAYEVLPGVPVNGDLTLGENIADLGGLTLAYYAYKIHRDGKPAAENVDGFTPEQRIFLGWAQVWQGHATDEYLRNQVTTDPHSPGTFRVIGPASNMPEYSEAWGCKEGDAMVRENKIIIW